MKIILLLLGIVLAVHYVDGDGFTCKGKNNGDYPDPVVCTKFVTCSNGIAYSMNCSAGLHFNKETLKCDYPGNAKCVDGDVSFCNGKKDGNYPNPSDCANYIACTGGTAYIMPCPAGLHYNSKQDKCDWPKNVNCEASPTSTKKPDITTTTMKPVDGDGFTCKGKKDGNHPDPADCAKFYTCSNEIDYSKKCPAGLHYDPRKDQCDDPKNVNCVASVFTCEGKETGNHRNPANCHNYYTCVGDRKYDRLCSTKTILNYNPKDDLCESPYQYKCVNITCTDKEDGNYPDPDDCTKYYECISEAKYIMACPEGKLYDEKKEKCDDPKHVHCG